MNYSELGKGKRGMNLESPLDVEKLDEGNDFLDQVSESSDPIEPMDENVITEDMVQEELDDIQGMGFIELISEKKALESRLQLLEDAKASLEYLQKMRKEAESIESDISKKIILSGAEKDAEKFGIDNIEEFLSEYRDSKEKLKRTLDFCNSRILEFENTKKTATFMNQSMCDLIDKRMKDLNSMEDSSKVKRMRKFYENTKNVYTNRDSVEWILEKIETKRDFLRRFAVSLRKDIKEGKDTTAVSAQKNAAKAFGKTFSMEQMTAFDKYLKKVFNPENDEKDLSVFMTQYILYIIYSDQKIWKYGNHKWVEAIIMNVLNILDNSYDLPNGIDYFNEQLLKIKASVMKDLPRVY